MRISSALVSKVLAREVNCGLMVPPIWNWVHQRLASDNNYSRSYAALAAHLPFGAKIVQPNIDSDAKLEK